MEDNPIKLSLSPEDIAAIRQFKPGKVTPEEKPKMKFYPIPNISVTLFKKPSPPVIVRLLDDSLSAPATSAAAHTPPAEAAQGDLRSQIDER